MLYGNAAVGQSGGPTSAINATLAGVIRGVLDSSVHSGQIGILYGMRNGIEGFLDEKLVNLNTVFADANDIERLETTPAAALGSCRKKLPALSAPGADEVYSRLLEMFRKYNIRYFFYIGGNDSMDTAAKLSEFSKSSGWEMRVIGVPKTIDNDLEGTDHTPGYGSAAKYIAVMTQEILRDTAVYTTKAVTIIEIMGRDAGWLAASSALGRVTQSEAPDNVYLPERIFSFEGFCRDIRAAWEKHPNVVMAVSEGIRYADGHYVGEGTQNGVFDVFGHKYLAGTGKALEAAVKSELGCKVRAVELSLPQRCAGHIASMQDITESVDVGKGAVRAAAQGITCEMMTIERTSDNPYSYRVGHTDVATVANRIRHVDDKYISSDGNNVTDGCLRYILPLISGERYPGYRDGLPVHCTIN